MSCVSRLLVGILRVRSCLAVWYQNKAVVCWALVSLEGLCEHMNWERKGQ